MSVHAYLSVYKYLCMCVCVSVCVCVCVLKQQVLRLASSQVGSVQHGTLKQTVLQAHEIRRTGSYQVPTDRGVNQLSPTLVCVCVCVCLCVYVYVCVFVPAYMSILNYIHSIILRAFSDMNAFT